MKCLHCGYIIPPDSDFCPYCGGRIVSPVATAPTMPTPNTGVPPQEEQKHVDQEPRYFDPDYGYSAENPMVVSSIPMIGYYLTAFRSEDGQAFTWERQPRRDSQDIDEYKLFLANEPYKTVFFRTGGNDTEHLPKGIAKSDDAFKAAQAGLALEELLAQREVKEKKKERRRVQRKKLFRAALCILVVAGLGMGIYFGWTYGHPFLRYQSGVKHIESDPQKAIEIFNDLGAYKDAPALNRWAHYYQMKTFAAHEDYEAALKEYDYFSGANNSKVLFNRLNRDGSIYQDAAAARDDAAELADICYQQLSVNAIEEADYARAIDLLNKMSRKEAVSAMYAECYYHLVLQNYDAQNWADAASLLDKLAELDLQNEFDVSDYRHEILYNYAESCLAEGTEESYSKGNIVVAQLIELDGKTDKLQDLQSRLTEAKQSAEYSAALKELNDGNYIHAITSFTALGNYKDSPTQVLEAMYQYVHHTQKPSFKLEFMSGGGGLAKIQYDQYFSYAKTLSEKNYKDSRQFYSSLK